MRENHFLEGGWLRKFLRCPRDLRLGPLLCKIFLNDLEKEVNNVLIAFVVDKELLGQSNLQLTVKKYRRFSHF